MLLLEYDTTKKKWMDENMIEFEAGNSKEYKVEATTDSAVYANKAKSHLPGLYYLVA